MRSENWAYLIDWLRTPDADWLVDEAVLGGLPLHEAEALLVDFDITPSRAELQRLAAEIDALLVTGAA